MTCSPPRLAGTQVLNYCASQVPRRCEELSTVLCASITDPYTVQRVAVVLTNPLAPRSAPNTAFTTDGVKFKGYTVSGRKRYS